MMLNWHELWAEERGRARDICHLIFTETGLCPSTLRSPGCHGWALVSQVELFFPVCTLLVEKQPATPNLYRHESHAKNSNNEC